MQNINIKKLETVKELEQLISVFSIAFEATYQVDNTYLENMLKNNATIIIGAVAENEVIGGLVAFEFNTIRGVKEIYIYDIAVHPGYQKQGIGKKLIEELKNDSKIRDVDTVFVEAESEDEHAVAFYKAIGGEEILVNHFNFKIK